MPWPVPNLFKAEASEFAKRHILGFSDVEESEFLVANISDKNAMMRSWAQEFSDKHFRSKFFEVVGHEFVLAMMRSCLGEKAPALMRVTDWKSALGVNSSTIYRWKRRLVMASAENFLATKLLIFKRSFTDLSLPADIAIMKSSILAAVVHYSRIIRQNHRLELSYSKFHTLLTCMAVMQERPDLVYDIGPRSEIHILSFNPINKILRELARQATVLNAARYTSRQASVVLPSDVYSCLSNFGLGYSLFAIGYRESWGKSSELVQGMSNDC